MLQNFQQQPVKPETNTQPHFHAVQTQAQNITTGLGMVNPQPPLPTQATQPSHLPQQKTAFDKVALCFRTSHKYYNIMINILHHMFWCM